MRSFVAIFPPDDMVEALMALQDGLPGRHVPAENLHVTLAFLGDAAEAGLADLHDALAGLAVPPVALEIIGIEPVPERRPKLIQATLRRGAALADLQARILRAALRVGLVPDRRRFRPHVTLTRFGAGARPADLPRIGVALANRGGAQAGPFEADTVSLVASRLHADGAIYDELARYGAGADL